MQVKSPDRMNDTNQVDPRFLTAAPLLEGMEAQLAS